MFPCWFLHLLIPYSLVIIIWWFWNRLNECCQFRIYPVNKIIPKWVSYLVSNKWNLRCYSLLRSLNKGDWSRMLMSLFDPETPKKACHIHKSCNETVSSKMNGVKPWSCLQYCPLSLFGQPCHSQCVQLRLSNIPRNPCFCSWNTYIFSKLVIVGFYK